MRPVNPKEEAACRVIMTNVFPGTDLVLLSQVFNQDRFGECLTIQGSNEPLETLFLYLRNLLNRGGSSYFWSGVHRSPSDIPGILLHLEETGQRVIPRMELIGYIFRRDAVDHCDLFISPQVLLEVISPWGQIVNKVPIGLPTKRNGRILIGLAD